MARYLYVKAGIVTNVVEHPTAPPAVSEDGADIVPDLTGTGFVGMARDVTAEIRETAYTRLDVVVLRECFRLTNEVRALQSLAPVSAAAYKNNIKALMT